MHTLKRRRTADIADQDSVMSDDVLDKLEEIAEKMTRVTEIVEAIKLKMDNGEEERLATFKSTITSNMTCCICLDSWNTPVRVAECCSTILGCDHCVRQWLNNNTSYPHCNSDNATTLVVRGLDGLVDLVKQ